uniref:Uncharacterized protein n=1 Tax=Glossina pallidipes TaxID=7398 RepID=A0A1B0ADH5_GLOPL
MNDSTNVGTRVLECERLRFLLRSLIYSHIHIQTYIYICNNNKINLWGTIFPILTLTQAFALSWQVHFQHSYMKQVGTRKWSSGRRKFNKIDFESYINHHYALFALKKELSD